MKYLITAIILVSFIGIATFGVFGMHIGAQHHDGGCVAAAIEGVDCPQQSSPVDYLAFHLTVFHNISTTTSSNISIALFIFSLFVVAIIFGVSKENSVSAKLAYYLRKWLDLFKLPFRDKALRWLTLHENSPAILL
ncbi:MAG: hypothetical protein ACKKL5_04245 [Candidatus Komeilibacteria bacterium]